MSNDIRSQYHKRRYAIRKTTLIELMGGRCVDCSVAEPEDIFEFDHVLPPLRAKVTTLFCGASWERILEEAARCELVCANCHRIRTAARYRVN
jgi:hypothetical protein